METDQNHTYVDILAFGLENAPDLSSTNELDEIVGNIDFDEIAASKTHAKACKMNIRGAFEQGMK